MLLSHPNDYLFICLLLTAHSPAPPSHTGLLLIILSAPISLLIAVSLFILEIKLSLSLEGGRFLEAAQDSSAWKIDGCISTCLTIKIPLNVTLYNVHHPAAVFFH